MKNYIEHDEWKVVERGFHAEHNEITESLMSLGNGRMGQRGNFEERFSGKTLQGNFVAGVWFPDKTRVGWWKNGYPDYFAKVINSINWLGIDIEIDGEMVDLANCEIINFYRELNMQIGTLMRFCDVRLKNGKEIHINSMRYINIVDTENAMIHFWVKPLNFDGKITLTPYLDGNVKNKDSNYEESFWEGVDQKVGETSFVQMRTKENNWGVERFDIISSMQIHFEVFSGEKKPVNFTRKEISKDNYVGVSYEIDAKQGEPYSLTKKIVNISSRDFPKEELSFKILEIFKRLENSSHHDHYNAWKAKWENCDIKIEGDVSAQQGIRFNIFHLLQTYTGQDARLNIGPKGFTGEKYGGVTYWDTEAYCIPFYLSASPFAVARNLLVYRHNHLQKAIENGEKLGFSGGAALYPMVTMNGEECHNEWEITFEEIHRNGAIAYAIKDYVNYTGDEKYLSEYGLDVLISISRFWAQRVNWSKNLGKYVMLGVTGPNEYENNVNNNWYTNYIAVWTLKYTLEAISKVKSDGDSFLKISDNLKFNEEESVKWKHIIENMHFPFDTERNVYLQQDGFLDKELLTVDQITEHRPINQKWSWDRILRSCFIKQADVLQGLYLFEEDFDYATHERNFDFYEPMTVHESSLSPCVHTILASKLGKIEKAYEMYVRTSRLDLDDYNNDTEDGLHITSMAGTWMSVIKGFGGMRVKNTKLHLNPILPEGWKSLAFRVGLKDNLLEIEISKETIKISNLSEISAEVSLFGTDVSIKGKGYGVFPNLKA